MNIFTGTFTQSSLFMDAYEMVKKDVKIGGVE